MSDSSAVINLRGLTKDYGSGRGAFDVTFSVERGEVFGFLGPNGAGKTVTMRNLMGFIRPDKGIATIEGMDCFRDRARIQNRLGYLPGEIACPDDMTGAAFLTFMARMKKQRDHARMRELIELFELDPSRRIRKMSKGTKQKVGLVCAFMTQPDVILLDEPTSGLDPLMQNRFIDLVLQEKKRGATILLSSHLFEEVERTCDRVAFIRAGHLAAVERMDDVRRSRKRSFIVSFATAHERDRYHAAHAETYTGTASGACERTGSKTYVGTASGACAAAHSTSPLTLEVEVAGDIGDFVKDLATYEISDLSAREQTLEELFLHLYGTEPGNANKVEHPLHAKRSDDAAPHNFHAEGAIHE